jgi:homoserine kinase
VTVSPGESAGIRIAVTGTLAQENLPFPDRIVQTMERWAGEYGRDLGAVRVEAHSEIPVARGLGSSGSATVAGLVAACTVCGVDPDIDQLFRLGYSIEGHPDNIGPALMGGCVVGMPDESRGVVWFRARVHPSMHVAVASPRRRVETAAARAVLPQKVDFAVARDQARRLAQLLHGLETAESRFLQIGSRDELHTPYRATLIPGCENVMRAACAAGAAASAISGSGSSVIALGTDSSTMWRAAEAMRQAFESAGEPSEIFVSRIPEAGFTIGHP